MIFAIRWLVSRVERERWALCTIRFFIGQVALDVCVFC